MMINKPKISVIIPVYNGAYTVGDSIKNVQNQTLKDIEIICVNDGSTDNTEEVLSLFCLEDKRIHVISKDNGGAGSARNVAIEYATGEYLAFLDADDEFTESQVLEVLFSKAMIHNAPIVGGSFANVSKDLEDYEKRCFTQEGIVSFNTFQYDYLFTRFIYQRNMIMEKNVRFPLYMCYEDPVFLLNAMLAAKWFYAVPINVYSYSGTHHGELSSSKTIDYLKALTDNLVVSAREGLGELHYLLYNRLFSSANYYAEKNLEHGGEDLLYAIIRANAAVDYQLLKKEGYDALPDECMPVMRSVYHSACRYNKIRKIFKH